MLLAGLSLDTILKDQRTKEKLRKIYMRLKVHEPSRHLSKELYTVCSDD